MILYRLNFALLVGIGVSFVASVFFAIATALFVFNAETTQGTIASLQEQTDQEGKVLFQPTFEFEAEGQAHVVTPSVFVFPPPGGVGDSVPVLYDPNNPSRARIDRFAYTWMLPVLLMGLAIGFGVLRFVMMTLMRPWWPSPAGGRPS